MPGPVLTDIRGTKKIALPGYENSEVEIYDAVLMGSYPTVQALIKNPEDVGALTGAFLVMIKGWNFTDKDGNALPVSKESLEMLSAEALTFIAEEVAKALEAKKKVTST